MRVPEGIRSNKNQVCKLYEAIYGLKQGARCWFELFEQKLKMKGFRSSSVDRCNYILDKNDIKENIYVILYVDDVLIITYKIENMNKFKNYLMSEFCMTDLKEISLFLGMKIERKNDTLTLNQSAYITTVLKKFSIFDCKAASTPLEIKLYYTALNSDVKYNAPCQSLIGCLMYIMICTRPDLSTAISILSRFANKSNKELWECLKRVLKYLKGTIDLKLTYSKRNYNDFLTGYADSDWAGNQATMKLIEKVLQDFYSNYLNSALFAGIRENKTQ